MLLSELPVVVSATVLLQVCLNVPKYLTQCMAPAGGLVASGPITAWKRKINLGKTERSIHEATQAAVIPDCHKMSV